MEDTFENVAHVVPTGIVDTIEELGGEHVLEFPDSVAHGPVDDDPKRHRDLRLDYWRGLYDRLLGETDGEMARRRLESLEDGYVSTEQLGSVIAHHARERRVVLWSTPTLEDRLLLWFAFEAANSADVEVRRIGTAEPQVPVTPDEEEYFGLRDLELDELAEGFDELVYPKEIYAEAGANLWQTFASSSPRKFAISIPHTEKFFPNIARLGERYGWLFPVADGEDADRLFPSKLDDTLLASVPSDEWATPLDILGGELVEDFPFIEDLVMAARLVDWARHADEHPYLESRVEDDAAGPFGRLAFRRTERADRICEEGFGEADGAPILEIGDCRVYASSQPWAKIVEGEYWWFERFDPKDDDD